MTNESQFVVCRPRLMDNVTLRLVSLSQNQSKRREKLQLVIRYGFKIFLVVLPVSVIV